MTGPGKRRWLTALRRLETILDAMGSNAAREVSRGRLENQLENGTPAAKLLAGAALQKSPQKPKRKEVEECPSEHE